MLHKKLGSYIEFNQMENFFRKLIRVWGNSIHTYSYEQFLSCMKKLKLQKRIRLTDQHLTNFFRIKTTSLDANIILKPL